jgi:hypothetical protein
MISWSVLLALAGVLLGSAASKTVAAARGTLSWPEGPVFLWWPVPVRAVIALEVAVALAVAFLPSTVLAGVVVAAAYGLLVLAAATLRGRSCACFGLTGGKIGWQHVAANASASAAALVAGVVIGSSSAPSPPARLVAVALAGLAVTGAALLAARRHVAAQSSEEERCLARAQEVLVLTMEECPACRALRLLLDGAGRRVRWHIVVGDDPMGALAEDRYPCAVALDADGEPTCPPRWGLADAQRLAESFLELDLRRIRS